MAEQLYEFTEDDGANQWTNDPSYMHDTILTNYASTIIDADLETLDTNEGDGSDLGVISDVEIGVYAYGDGGDQIETDPLFGGLTSGAGTYTHTPGTGPPGAWTWQSIYNDANGPGAGSWGWDDIQNLDCEVYYRKDAKANTMYCAAVRIRVTYTAAAPDEEFAATQGITPSPMPEPKPSPVAY